MKTWIISDTHFGHNNMYKFTNMRTGALERPWASNADEGDAIMIENWNKVIKPEDKVYHLGDVAIPRRGLKCMKGLNGRKVLIRGNHDIFKMKDYAEYFDDIRGTHKIDRFILSHYPIHEESIPHWCGGIIHGHTHGNLVLKSDDIVDNRYMNVCVEHTSAAPIEFDAIVAEMASRNV